MNKFSIIVVIMVLSDVKCSMNNRDMANILNLIQDSEDKPMTMKMLRVIFPGTKWCGVGNIAYSYSDLGFSYATDQCCRTHDNCPEVISALGTGYGLTNYAIHSRLSCRCDQEFYNCLRKVNTNMSKVIGKLYFNVIGTKCFRADYPVIGCGWKEGRKCMNYIYDTQKPMINQWFDVPTYL